MQTEDPGDAGGATYIGYYAHGIFTDTNFTRNRAEAVFYSQTVSAQMIGSEVSVGFAASLDMHPKL